MSSIEERLLRLEQAVLNSNPRDLTVVSLKEHIDTRLEAIEAATRAAAATMDKRLNSMNEFRDTLRDQASRFVTRDELAAQLARTSDITATERAVLRDQIQELKTFKTVADTKASISSVYISYALGILGLLVGVAGLILKLIS